MSKAPKAKKAKTKAAAKAETPTAQAAETPPRAGAREIRPGAGKRVLGLIAFILIIAGIIYGARPLWSPIIAPYVSGLQPQTGDTPAAGAPAETAPGDKASLEEMESERQQMQGEMNRLMARMESIETSVEEVKKMISATAGPRGEDGGEDGQGPSLVALWERLNELEKSGDTLNSLIERIDQMEKEGAAGNTAASPGASTGASGIGQAKALVLVVASLREAIAKDTPYRGALESLEAIAADNPDIKTAAVLLAENAKTGIPTLATLRGRFDGLAGKIVQASKTLEEKGWMERAANRITSLVTWRRVDGHEKGTSVDAIVARAEARLKEGNLPAAVKVLEDLSGFEKAAIRAAPWLRDAKARVTAERAVATLHVYTLSLLKPVKE